MFLCFRWWWWWASIMLHQMHDKLCINFCFMWQKKRFQYFEQCWWINETKVCSFVIVGIWKLTFVMNTNFRSYMLCVTVTSVSLLYMYLSETFVHHLPRTVLTVVYLFVNGGCGSVIRASEFWSEDPGFDSLVGLGEGQFFLSLWVNSCADLFVPCLRAFLARRAYYQCWRVRVWFPSGTLDFLF